MNAATDDASPPNDVALPITPRRGQVRSYESGQIGRRTNVALPARWARSAPGEAFGGAARTTP
ncbi:hypothetical protein GGR72_001755 [Xanthomonas arboricola]|nr:hypothetical protein [Xanthomonas arboricola]